MSGQTRNAPHKRPNTGCAARAAKHGMRHNGGSRAAKQGMRYSGG